MPVLIHNHACNQERNTMSQYENDYQLEPIEDNNDFDFDEVEPDDKSFEAVKKAQSRNDITKARAKFVGDGNLDDLLGAVTKFARSKIHGRLYDSPGGVSNVDDEAQEVAMYVWEHLGDFNGAPESFAPWLNRMCFCKATAEFKTGKASRDKFEELTVQDEDGDVDDNPAIYANGKKRNGKPMIGGDQADLSRELPDWIQGVDRWICDLIREDRTYAQIAKFLHITEMTVRKRVAKMKAKNLELAKNSGQVKRVRVKGKWIDAVPQDTAVTK
jgi:DNA-directed RNA polymerase specialized sigma24 family protein